MKTAKAPPRVYPPGYFTELVYLHNWPPGFVPKGAATNETARQIAGRKSREVQIANGHPGSVFGISRKGDTQTLSGCLPGVNKTAVPA